MIHQINDNTLKIHRVANPTTQSIINLKLKVSKQCLEFPVLHAAKTSRRMKEAWRKSIICNKPLQAALHAGIVFTPPLACYLVQFI